MCAPSVLVYFVLCRFATDSKSHDLRASKSCVCVLICTLDAAHAVHNNVGSTVALFGRASQFFKRMFLPSQQIPNIFAPQGLMSSAHLLQLANHTISPPFPHPSCAHKATCPIGSYCKQGVALPCPVGTYGSSPGLSSPLCSGLCPAGRYCPAGTFPNTSEEEENGGTIGMACPPGRYGMEGMRDSACTGPCHAGFYCPEVGGYM